MWRNTSSSFRALPETLTKIPDRILDPLPVGGRVQGLDPPHLPLHFRLQTLGKTPLLLQIMTAQTAEPLQSGDASPAIALVHPMLPVEAIVAQLIVELAVQTPQFFSTSPTHVHLLWKKFLEYYFI
jgi:hypothetical protein